MNDHDLITTMRNSFTGVESATPVEQIVGRSKVIRARRRVPGAVAVVAAAAAAGTAIALIPSGSATPAPIPARTTAYVVSHVARALDAMPGGTVLFIRRTTVPARYRTERWADGDGRSRAETFTLAGQPVRDIGISTGTSGGRSTRTVVVIDYGTRTWSRAVTYLPSGNSEPPATWTCDNVENDILIANAGEMAAQLREALSCGDLKVTGGGTASGVHAVRLSGDFHGGNAVTYWVNAATYLPFRFRWAVTRGRELQESLRWLPPTAASRAKMNVPIPAGFTRVRPGNASSS